MRELLARTIIAVLDYITFWRYCISHSQSSDFVSMGLGIKARYRRHRRDWEPHLGNTKKFIEMALSNIATVQPIAVLGAGHLLDFPLSAFEERNLRVDLYDYNPSLLPYWQRVKARSASIDKYHCCDLTGVLNDWYQELRRLPKGSSGPEIATLLSQLPHRFPPNFSLVGYSTIISLNILSQIGLYWQDRVSKFLVERGLLRTSDADIPQPIQSALTGNCTALEKAHLLMIESAGAQQVVIICDENYQYYQKGTSAIEQQSALEVEVSLANHHLVTQNCWDWHIAPEGAEGESYGEIHKVVAKVFRSVDYSVT